MTRPIRLLISDIDGTLAPPDKILTPRSIRAVAALGEAGIAFSLISSRPPRGMLKIVEQLGVRCPISAFNGATVTTPDLTVISALRLAPDAARETLALLAKTGVDAWVFADDVWLLENPGATSVARERRAVGFEPVVTTGFEAVIHRIDKIVGVCDDPELLSRVEAEMRATLGGDVNAIRSQAYYLDITHPKADKGAGVLALCAAIGVDAALTAVIGDMANDVAMFRVAGLSIAMGQAPDDVKAEADAVTGPNTDEGFARAVETLVLTCASDCRRRRIWPLPRQFA